MNAPLMEICVRSGGGLAVTKLYSMNGSLEKNEAICREMMIFIKRARRKIYAASSIEFGKTFFSLSISRLLLLPSLFR